MEGSVFDILNDLDDRARGADRTQHARHISPEPHQLFRSLQETGLNELHPRETRRATVMRYDIPDSGIIPDRELSLDSFGAY